MEISAEVPLGETPTAIHWKPMKIEIDLHIVLCSIDQHTLCGLDHGVDMLHQVRGYTSPQDFLNDRYGTLRLRLLCAVCGVIPIMSSPSSPVQFRKM
jgi:hypothetical protein